MRKDMRDREDTRGTKYTYYISCFLILLLVKSRLQTFPILIIFLLNFKYETKDKTIHIFKKILKFL